MRTAARSRVFVIAIAALAVAAGSSTAPVPAQAAPGSACSGQASSSAAGSIELAGIGGFDVAKWFGEKAGGAAAGKAGGMAVEFLTKITGLDKILPESNEAKIVRQLDEIKLQLSAVSERLDRLTENVGQLISEERQSHLDAALSKLCSISIRQQVLFEQQYVPLIRAGSELGQILTGPNPELATVKGPSGFSPRERVKALRDDFIRVYEKSDVDLEGGIKEIHAALTPGSLQTSVLAAYGQVLMTKRFLTRADSELLRGLYEELAQVAALASWMAAEFRATAPQNPEALLNVMKNYVRTSAEERQNLPPMIAPSMVIDLGKVNSTTTTGKPIWYPPSEEDLAWLPKNTLPAPYGAFAVNEVDKAMEALKSWTVPNKVQLTALLSEGCIADPDNPAKFANGACKNAIGPKNGANVAGYLQRLNPDDRTWQQLFCQSGPLLTCAPGVGPAPGGAPPHAFIWTREAVTQKVKCGWTIIPPGQSSRVYSTYTGFHTLATGASQAAFPPLPDKAPGYSLQNDSIAHNMCDAYFSVLARGDAARSVLRSPWVSGILLATRNTGAADLNPTNGIDFMAQRPASCAGELATIVGTNRDDRIRGTAGRDVIVARGGDDVVRALAGSDVVCGNSGADLLLGGRGNDRLHGQGGDDDLRGGPGKDALRGGPGKNALRR